MLPSALVPSGLAAAGPAPTLPRLLDWFGPSHGTMLALLVGFAVAHSGLAALRPWGEARIGPRAYRVLFAIVSLTGAVALIVYFFNHRYDGLLLWDVRGEPWAVPLVWGLSALSFVFLYPATFNLLEIAAIDKPAVHLYETGIIRITRHPQMVGQVIWCAAHSLWIGSTFVLLTSAGLILHHLFAVWHGDRRLLARYGAAFEAVRDRTSVMPFWAIVRGRQTLKFGEFVRPAYAGVAAFVLLLWWAHPALIRVTAATGW